MEFLICAMIPFYGPGQLEKEGEVGTGGKDGGGEGQEVSFKLEYMAGCVNPSQRCSWFRVVPTWGPI